MRNEREWEVLERSLFQFQDLDTPPSNFEPEALLGEGGFGQIYKGSIDQKTLTPSKSGTDMRVVIRLWNFEIIQALNNVLGRRYHPNLIELLGYCLEDETLVPVYKCTEKGSLKNHLFPSRSIKQQT